MQKASEVQMDLGRSWIGEKKNQYNIQYSPCNLLDKKYGPLSDTHMDYSMHCTEADTITSWCVYGDHK